MRPAQQYTDPNGLSVSDRRRPISSRSTGGGLPLNDMMPNPPALLTAAASSGPLINPIGAAKTGTSMANRSGSGVRDSLPYISDIALPLQRK